jgi:hypothetical protein
VETQTQLSSVPTGHHELIGNQHMHALPPRRADLISWPAGHAHQSRRRPRAITNLRMCASDSAWCLWCFALASACEQQRSAPLLTEELLASGTPTEAPSPDQSGQHCLDCQSIPSWKQVRIR